MKLTDLCLKIVVMNGRAHEAAQLGAEEILDRLHKMLSRNEQIEQLGKYKRWCGGVLASEINYKDGVKHGMQFDWWWTSGNLLEVCEYIDGVREGKYLRWWRDGTLAEECFYKQGKRHGLRRRWSSKGKLRTACYYDEGRPTGVERRMCDNGQLIEWLYEEGDNTHELSKIVRRKTWDKYGNLIENKVFR
jgi:antitoxin component YwqK of YwqJK toxin-antitoxin module